MNGPAQKHPAALGNWKSTFLEPSFPMGETVGQWVAGLPWGEKVCQSRSLSFYPPSAALLSLWSMECFSFPPHTLRFWNFHSGVLSEDSC